MDYLKEEIPKYQEQINGLTREYVRLFASEFKAFRTQQRAIRATLKDEKFARLDKGSDEVVERKLHEVPENLYVIFKGKLSLEAFHYFVSKEGSRWFANTYPVFKTGLGEA